MSSYSLRPVPPGRLPRVSRRTFESLPLLTVVLLLVGCAGPARVASTSDFPFHATDDPFFTLHWRLDQNDGVVRAVGLVEAARVDGIAEVMLELVGLDKDGRVISRGIGRTYGGRILRWQAKPFVVRLRSIGQESRFELRVWGFDWEGARGARGGH